MKNRRIRIIVLYSIGVIINFIPTILAYFSNNSKLNGGSENFVFLTYSFLFLLSFIFYISYLFLNPQKKHSKLKRKLIVFLPSILFFVLILFFCIIHTESLYAAITYFPCVILNFSYCLILESNFAAQETR